MNEAEKAREAREKAELAQQKHREELQRQREENRNIRKQKMPKIVKSAWYVCDVLWMLAMVVFAVLMFCFDGYGLVFWLSCAVGAGAIALFVWAIFVELANDTWGGLVLALLVVEGGIYLILLIARTCAGL